MEINCPRCQTANPDGARFCLKCANQLQAPSSSRVDGERKYLSVLFADVVDSTAVAERLDPEHFAEIMNGAFAFLNASVTKYGGTVARLLGDAVLAFFGAPVAHEDDAERAVRAALEIQAAAREYAQMVRGSYGVDFAVRVGINTGLAVLASVGDKIRTEYTAMGETTNVAARMQSAALPGTVLISAQTYHLVKELFEFEGRGATEVKGKSTLIETYEVLSAKAVPGKVRGLEGTKQYLDTALGYYRRNDMRPYLARALQSQVYWHEQQGHSAEAEQLRTESRKLLEELSSPLVRPLPLATDEARPVESADR